MWAAGRCVQLSNATDGARRTANCSTRRPRADRSSFALPSEELAYAITRMTEGFNYCDSVAEIEPVLSAAVRIVKLLID